jgi:hypothetical protein
MPIFLLAVSHLIVPAGGKIQRPSTQKSTGVKHCPAPSPVFTGCDTQVSQVKNCLLGGANERRVCVIHGLGGTGKTQISLKAIETTKDDWTDIVYVDATSQETTISTLKAFAVAKKVGESHEDAIGWLESHHQSWLMVFDNADDPDLNLLSFIPQGSHGSVLITTRLQGLALLGQGPKSDCCVGGMDPQEAVELFLKKARMHDQALEQKEIEAANELVKVSSRASVRYLYLTIHAPVGIRISSSGDRTCGCIHLVFEKQHPQISKTVSRAASELPREV